MGLFNKKNDCCSGGTCSSEESKNCRIKILGTGCANCIKLEENTKIALEELGIEECVGHITDFAEIAKYGVMSTPGLVVDEKVVSYGKVLKPEEIKELLGDLK